MSQWIKLILLGALAVLIVCFFAWIHREMSIDKCLDGGGAWDYERVKCDKD